MWECSTSARRRATPHITLLVVLDDNATWLELNKKTGLIDGTQAVVPSQHPRPRHRPRNVGHRLLLVNSDHPFSDLLIDAENWLGSAVVS